MAGVREGSLHVIAVLVVLPMHGRIIGIGRAIVLLLTTLGNGNCRLSKCTDATAPFKPFRGSRGQARVVAGSGAP